jgi:hypothetical protein
MLYPALSIRSDRVSTPGGSFSPPPLQKPQGVRPGGDVARGVLAGDDHVQFGAVDVEGFVGPFPLVVHGRIALARRDEGGVHVEGDLPLRFALLKVVNGLVQQSFDDLESHGGIAHVV